MSWLELSIETKAEAVDWVCSLLSANGYDGEVRVGAGGAGWPHRVAFYLPRADRRAAARLAEALDGVTRTGMAGALRVEAVAGKPRAPPEAARPLGRRFVLLGPLAPAPPAGDRLPIRLGAGLAFGSGLHPTTLATLRLVERHARAGQRALDLGSGSGILSIALARLGARVLALDNDPVAVEATRAAVRINGVGDAVEVRHGSLGRGAGLGHWLRWAELAVPPAVDPAGPFDLIAANVLARFHAELADDYRRALAPDGVVLTAGYTRDAQADVARALAAAGLAPLDRVVLGDYVAHAYTR